MRKVRLLRTLVKQRLNVAVEEIFELFERTIAEFEEELRCGKEENERGQGKLLDAMPRGPSHEADVWQVLAENREEEEEVPSEQQEEPAELSHIKEEEDQVCRSRHGEQLQGMEEEADVNTVPRTSVFVKREDDKEDMWNNQDGERLQQAEEADVITFTLTGVHVKSEEDEGQSSRLHHNPNEKFSQHTATEAVGESCDEPHSQADSFASLSDTDMMPHSSDIDQIDDPREPLETNEQSKGMTSKGAEIARRYRERRDADPDRRKKYLEKERDKWKKQRETGKKKSVHELSEIEKWALRKKWREAKSQARARNRTSALLQSETPSNSLAAVEFPENHPAPGSIIGSLADEI
ncbi:uncharacterized protein LOC144063107 [Vanacampus margaritifer]